MVNIGLHNIREKLNEHYVESNSNEDSDNIDLLVMAEA